MFSKYRTKLLIVLALAQVLFLVGIAGSSYAATRFGEQIRIRTVPVDPRDVFYGDYVVLKYAITDLNKSLWKEPGNVPSKGEAVYVLLKPKQAGEYEAAGVYRTKPSAGNGTVVLKGRAYDKNSSEIQVRYGLEKYYVSENQGKDLERKAGKTIAVVYVASWGQAVLKGLEEVR